MTFNTVRSMLICLFFFLSSIAFSQATSLPSADSLKLVTSNMELDELKKLAISNWKEVSSFHLNKHKANFFYIDNHVDFIEYLEGNHNVISERTQLARNTVDEIIGFTLMYANSRNYAREEIEYYIRKSRDFWTVRYCPNDLKEAFYQNYSLLLTLK